MENKPDKPDKPDKVEKCPLSGKPCSKFKNIRVSEVIGKQGVTVLLCGQCANNYYNQDGFALLEPAVKQVVKPVEPCPNCGLTLREVKEMGRLGCLRCFKHFGASSLAFLDKGLKIPEPTPEPEAPKVYSSEMEELEDKIRIAVSKEKYEEAAELKKRIKAIEDANLDKDEIRAKIDAAVLNDDFEEADKLRACLTGPSVD